MSVGKCDTNLIGHCDLLPLDAGLADFISRGISRWIP